MMPDVPQLYRIVLQVADIDRAAAFYGTLLGSPGRRIHTSRHYFDCGSVILGLVDTSEVGQPQPMPDHVYFSVADIEAVHARARQLGALSTADVHGESAGAVVMRPWRERSFYAADPDGNRLCFVDAKTIFTGR